MPLAGFQIMLRSASSEVAAEIGREQIEKSNHKKIAGALRGERAEPGALVAILAPLF